MTGAGHKLSSLERQMARLKPRIVVVTETHLDASFEDGEVAINGYSIIRLDRKPFPKPTQAEKDAMEADAGLVKKAARKGKRSGGVLIYVADGVVADRVTTFADQELEMVAFEDSTAKIRYVATYRRPGNKISEPALEAIQGELIKGEAMVLGDLNLNKATWIKRPQPAALDQALKGRKNYNQHVRFITRKPRGSKQKRGSIIDHVWCPFPCVCSPLEQLDGVSDHRAIQVHHNRRGAVQNKVRDKQWVFPWHLIDTKTAQQLILDELPGEKVAAGHRKCLACQMRGGIHAPHAKIQKRHTKTFEQEFAAHEMCKAGVERPSPASISKSATKSDQNNPASMVHAWENGLYNIRWCMAGPHAMLHKRAQPRLKQKWMTPAVLAAISRRDQLLKNRGESQGRENDELFKTARRVAQTMERAEKGKWIRGQWDKLGKKTIRKAHWAFYHRIAGTGKKCQAEPECSPQKMLQVLKDKLQKVRNELDKYPEAPIP
eukprot:gene4137-4634_t